jgi:hypothetical protein
MSRNARIGRGAFSNCRASGSKSRLGPVKNTSNSGAKSASATPPG